MNKNEGKEIIEVIEKVEELVVKLSSECRYLKAAVNHWDANNENTEKIDRLKNYFKKIQLKQQETASEIETLERLLEKV